MRNAEPLLVHLGNTGQLGATTEVRSKVPGELTLSQACSSGAHAQGSKVSDSITVNDALTAILHLECDTEWL